MMKVNDDHNKAKIRSIKELVDHGLSYVPLEYIRPLEQRPRVGDMYMSRQQLPVPTINLGNADFARPQIVHDVAQACADWGVFQVINHNVPTYIQDEMWNTASNFFALPIDKKLELVPEEPKNPLKYFTSFVKNESVREWKDTFGLRPSHDSDFNLVPKFIRNPFFRFQNALRDLENTMFHLISTGLGLEVNDFRKYVSRQTIAMNYYPTCPQPELTFGISSHSDFGSLTFLIQDGVSGLQIRKGDHWIDVPPKPNAIIVLIGDQIEILTNGRYKSVEHRVLTNTKKQRMSMAVFYSSKEHEKVGPLDKFITREKPPMYRETKFSDYLAYGFAKGLNGKSNLEYCKLKEK